VRRHRGGHGRERGRAGAAGAQVTPTVSEVERGAADLVVASNRGPVEMHDGADGVVARRGSGGLIAVLGPALASRGGVWVASALTPAERAMARAAARGRLRATVELPEGPVGLRLLDHDRVRYAQYYGRTSNELLWFLHHHMFDLTRQPVFDAALRASWSGYRDVNDAFAAACAEEAAEGGAVLIQDYHLSLAPRRLRSLRPDVRSAHFTMVPWADPDYFAVVPEPIARELVDGLLGADMVCFLVARWAEAFLACCQRLGYAVDRARTAVRDGDGRWAAVRCFPVGVDPETLRRRASEPDVERHKRALRELAGDRRLVVRVDRMEPSKNVLRGLAAFSELLQREPALRGRVVHFVLAYASRGELAAYRQYAEDVRRRVEEINRRFGTADWRPVVLETRNDFGRGLAAMALADVLVVNPLRDGMNLVAKEGPVVSEGGLALVLSRHAGAVDDLADGAALVDPFDVSALAARISSALAMSGEERAARLDKLRRGAGALPPGRWLAAATAELERVAAARPDAVIL